MPHLVARDVTRCHMFALLGTPSGESGSTARGSQTLKLTCEATQHTSLWADSLILLLPGVFPSRQLPTFGFGFVPRDFLRGLLRMYGVDLPTELTRLKLHGQDAGDSALTTALSNIDVSTISYFGELSSAPCTPRTYPAHCSEIIEHR